MASAAFGADAAGAVLTSEDVQRALLEPLAAETVMLAALTEPASPVDGRPAGVGGMPAGRRGGAIVVSSHGLPVKIPRLDAMDEPTFVAENTLIPEANATFGEVTLLGPNVRRLKTLHRVSNELALAAVGNVSALLTTALVTRMARALDRALLAGDPAATPGSPLGLLNWSGIQRVAVGGPISIDTLHSMWGFALAENARPTAWLLNPRDLISLRKLKDSTGQYLLTPDPTMASAYSLLGSPAYTSTMIPIDGGPLRDTTALASTDAFTLTGHGVVAGAAVRFSAPTAGSLPAPIAAGTTYYAATVTANTFTVAATPGGPAIDLTADGSARLRGSQSSVALVDGRQVAIGRDQDVTVAILDQTFGHYDQVAIRVTSRWDAVPINPAGIVIATGVTA